MSAGLSLSYFVDVSKSKHTTPPSGPSLSPADGCFRAIWAASLTDCNWPDGCLWALAPQCSPSPKCAVYPSSALRETIGNRGSRAKTGSWLAICKPDIRLRSGNMRRRLHEAFRVGLRGAALRTNTDKTRAMVDFLLSTR